MVSFMDPSQDPKGSGYQVIQSKIAVGSGALWGRGVTKGTQTQGRFLPVPHKDFIFAAFAEEHGFVGVVVVLGLYFLLLMQIVQNGQTASDRAGMYICMGIASAVAVSRVGERRNGDWKDAGYGYSPSTDEFRRIEYCCDVFNAGACEQCPAPAICKLKRTDERSGDQED